MRCIVHLDMDCFYAQVECVRLGLDCRTQPFVVVQWGALIAVNYPARAMGVRRFHDNFSDAQTKCPSLKFSYSPTYRLGETTTQYHANPQKQSHKVSLEPYREASRKIFSILRNSEPGVEIEKGGIDEAYLDVTEAAQLELARVEQERAAAAPGVPLDALRDVLEPETKLIADRTEEMAGFFASRGTTLESVYDGPMRALKRGEAWASGEGSRGYWVREGSTAAERAEADANCLLLCAASRVVARLRARIYADLHYDCSAGIAHNRLLAKCISAAHKPRQQTLLLPDRAASALFDLPLDKVRGFGGKLGDAISEICGGGAVLCRDVWLAPLSRLQLIGTALMDGDDGELDSRTGRDPLDDAPLPDRVRTRLRQDELADPTKISTNMAAAYHAFYRMRGFDTDVLQGRLMSKSLIAMKHFVASTSDLAEVLPWVTVLAAELADRYRDFTNYYGCKGRTLNVKAGTGFLATSDVYSHTVALPEIVSAETLVRVATRELKLAFSPRSVRGAGASKPAAGAATEAAFTVPVESVTLTIGGIAQDGGAAQQRMRHAGQQSAAAHAPAQQTTLTGFLSGPMTRRHDRKRPRQQYCRSGRDNAPELVETVEDDSASSACEVISLGSDQDQRASGPSTGGADVVLTGPVHGSEASSSVVALSQPHLHRSQSTDAVVIADSTLSVDENVDVTIVED